MSSSIVFLPLCCWQTKISELKISLHTNSKSLMNTYQTQYSSAQIRITFNLIASILKNKNLLLVLQKEKKFPAYTYRIH